ncbi:MAG: DUF1444 family protein [Chloroflexi bacterium OHK40]
MSDEPVLDVETFAEAMEQRLRAQPAITVRERDGLTLRLHMGESDITLTLDNFYRSYTQQPADLDQVADQLLRSLRTYDAARSISSFEALRERVFPMLKPVNLLLTVRERKLPMLIYRPFLADLIICYVIEEPSSVAYITEQHLERWQLSEHELHEQALTNLRRRTDERGSYTATGDGAQRLVIFNTQDGYDATRLLLPTLLERWRTEIPGTMVIGVPNRDFLIIFSDADRTILGNVARQIQLDSANREHGLTDQLFTLEEGQVREYEWD